MPFCSNCGADVTNKSFCGQCGTPAGAVPVAAPAASGAQVTSGRIKPVVWILGGIAAFFVVIGFVVVSSGLFFAHRFTRNPALATAKLLTAGNPDIDVVSADRDRNTVTFRNRKSNETVTMNFDDFKQGKIVFTSNGKKATVQARGDGENGSMEIHSADGSLHIGAGSSAKIPSWVPVYPGVSPQVTFSMQGSDADGGTYQFKTKDSLKDVLSFYENGLKTAGFAIAANLTTPTGAMLSAEDHNTKHAIVVTAGTEDGGAAVNIVFSNSKK